MLLLLHNTRHNYLFLSRCIPRIAQEFLSLDHKLKTLLPTGRDCLLNRRRCKSQPCYMLNSSLISSTSSLYLIIILLQVGHLYISSRLSIFPASPADISILQAIQSLSFKIPTATPPLFPLTSPYFTNRSWGIS